MGKPETKGARTAAAVRRAGRQLIFRYGFEAMSLRQLAAEVGIQPASLYNHIATKQDLLFDLMREHMDALLAQADAALKAAAPDPVAQLRAFAASHVLYHLERKQDVYIANFELRSLEPHSYDRIMCFRHIYEGRLISILDHGLSSGALNIGDTHIVAYAILAMLTGVCTWYKPDGRLEKTELVAIHLDIMLSGLRPQDSKGSQVLLPFVVPKRKGSRR